MDSFDLSGIVWNPSDSANAPWRYDQMTVTAQDFAIVTTDDMFRILGIPRPKPEPVEEVPIHDPVALIKWLDS